MVGPDSVFIVSTRESIEAYTDHRVIAVGSLDEAIEVVKAANVALVLLDIPAQQLHSPQCSEFGLLLDGGTSVVIILDPAVCPVMAIQVGSGPNEYFLKPLRLGTILERIDVLLSPELKNKNTVWEIGELYFEPSKNLLRHRSNGTSVRLTEKERLILEMLCQGKPTSVSRENLLRNVWGYKAGITTHTLETHVYRLRKKLRLSLAIETPLVTTADGYKLQT